MTLAYLQVRGPGPGLRGRARSRGCSAGPWKAGEGLAPEAARPSPAGAAWPFGSASRLRLQTWARVHSRPLPPTPPAFYAIRVLAPAAALPALPTSLSGMSTRESPMSCQSRKQKLQAPPFATQDPGLSHGQLPSATVPPQRAQTARRPVDHAEQSPCLSSRVSDLLLRFLESLLPSRPQAEAQTMWKSDFY